jgi:ssDNA-binding Zn-finger/Zn-ribbon topoisomerase 1
MILFMVDFKTPIRELGPVECANCGTNMVLILAEINATTLDYNGIPKSNGSYMPEGYLYCPKCHRTEGYKVDLDTQAYSVLTSIESKTNIEDVLDIPSNMSGHNPFLKRKE